MRTISIIALMALAGCRTVLIDTTDTAEPLIDQDGDGFDASLDCNDADAAIHPDAPELCDGIDNNCDNDVDGDDAIDALTFYQDSDGDGHGDPNAPITACEAFDGVTLLDDDCDDADDIIFPGADESDCTDPVDYNCDGSVGFEDDDDDGWAACEDCDDRDPAVFPGSPEVAYDGLDNDCDETTLDDDLDQDGFVVLLDCDDEDPSINPDADEEPYDGIDNDCNSATVDDDLDGDLFPSDVDCDDNDVRINPNADEEPYDGVDNDCDPDTPDDDLDADGFGVDDDCDDTDAQVSPSAQEFAYDGVDNDCDETTLDDDLDQDGYPLRLDCDDRNPDINPGVSETAYDQTDNDCDANTPDDDLDADGFVAAEDCDDTDAQVNPNAFEFPYDGVDNDCDPATPDTDLDGDGVGVGDCNDRDPTISPLVDEQPYDGVDNDCDPTTLDDDLDQDGFPNAVDCDDENAEINPSANEVTYDGIDNDCRPATLDDDLDQDGFIRAEDCDDTNPGANPDAAEIFYDGIDQACDGGDDFDQDGDGRQAYGQGIGGDDCIDTNPDVSDCGRSAETALPTCLDIHDVAPDLPSGSYWIDPTGDSPIEITCDMVTDGGGWTEIPYTSDLPFIQHFAGGDAYRYLPDDFELGMTDAQIDALRAASTEARQRYVGQCSHVIHYRYQTSNFAYAAGFRYHDGSQTPSATSDYGPTITVVEDACQPNDFVDRQTVFELRTMSLPVVNITLRDAGDNNERFGSPLTRNPVRMR